MLSTMGKGCSLCSLVCDVLSCVFVTFPYGVLGELRYLIVSIPHLCLLPCFLISSDAYISIFSTIFVS